MTEAPTEWILLVHIGPVQDFIASARRCRDLWYGSRLLSVLASAATHAMLERAGLSADEWKAAAIFPGVVDHGDRSVANKIQLRLHKTRSEIEEIAAAGHAAVQARVAEIAGEVYDRVSSKDTKGHFHREAAEQHVEDLMEFLWVAVQEEGEYAGARARAERLLAARKNTRDWGQPPVAQAGIPKSSLDGVRESVIDESVFDRSGDYSDGRRRRVFGVGSAERLCGVGMLKRLGNDPAHHAQQPRFHSAGHIASAALRARAEREPEFAAGWQRYLHALDNAGVDLGEFHVQNGDRDDWLLPDGTIARRTLPTQGEHRSFGLDGVLLFPERLNSLIAEYADDLDEAAADCAEHELQRLLQSLGASRGPHPYYAMILADGDHMGVALSTMSDPDAHRTFSEVLEGKFAAECGGVVEKHGGSLLYAGGDDVLAIAPVVTALQLSRELRDLFNSAMEVGAPENARPTLSVGIAICHFLEPFANVRRFAKRAEGLAKNSAGRNALAMIVKKRGAAEKIVYGKWRDTPDALDRRLLTWAQLLDESKLPTSTAYHLEEIIATFGVAREDAPVSAELVTALVKRVIRRRQLADDLRQKLEDLFTEVYLREEPDPLKAVQMMSHELQIAMLVKEARAQAGVDPHEEQAV